jgi:HlyD family secretion protein
MAVKKRVVAPVIVVIVVAALAVAVTRNQQEHDGLLASGTVEATEARLGFQAPGRIASVHVHEGDAVTAGTELARLDRREMEARRTQAEAEVDVARAILVELQHGFRSEEIAQAQAAAAAARQRRQDAERDLSRTRRLVEGGAVSQESLDKAELALDVARSLEEQADQQLQLLRSGPRQEKIQAQQAQLARAESALQVIETQLDNMLVTAPFEGVITVRHHEPGEIVAAGIPIVTLMNRDDRWVRIYIPEPRIGAAYLGQPASIRCDTYPDTDYQGEISFIASEAEFTPKSVQTTEERVKLVYAAKVRIQEDARYDLKPGMPVDVRLEERHAR